MEEFYRNYPTIEETVDLIRNLVVKPEEVMSLAERLGFSGQDPVKRRNPDDVDWVQIAKDHPEDMRALRKAVRALRKQGVRRTDLGRHLFPGGVYCYYAGCDNPLLVNDYIGEIEKVLKQPHSKFKITDLDERRIAFHSSEGSPVYKLVGLRDVLTVIWAFSLRFENIKLGMYLTLSTTSEPENGGYNWVIHLASEDIILQSEEIPVELAYVGEAVKQVLSSYVEAAKYYEDEEAED